MEKIQAVLPSVLANIKKPETAKRICLMQRWPEIVGEKLAKQTLPRLNDRGQLVIWVAESALAFEVNQRYRNSILKRAQAVLGEEAVQTVRVRVGQLR